MKPKFCSLHHLSLIVVGFAAAGFWIPSAQATSNFWNVDAAGNWATAGSWLGGVDIPGATSGTTSTDLATFGVTLTADRIVTVDANRNIGGITFTGNNTNFKYTLSGGNLLLTNAGVIQVDSSASSGTHTDTISSAIEIQGDGGTAAFTNNGANTRALSIGAVTGVSTGSNVTTLTLNGSSTSTSNAVTGVIGNGAGGGKLAVVKSDAGTWNLNGINTYSGGFTLNAGTIVLGRDSGGAVGAVTSGALGTGTTTLNGGSLLASSTNNVGGQKNVFNAINVSSGTTILGASTSTANLRLMGAITGAGTLSNSITGTIATSAIFGGNLSGFTGTFSFQGTGSLTNFRFGDNTGSTGTPLVATVDASSAIFTVNTSSAIGSGTKAPALTDNMSNSVLKMGSLSGNGLLAGSFQGSGTQLVNTYEIGYLNTDTTFSGSLSQTATVANSASERNLAITKVGTGSLTLSGTASGYTGNTTVRDGTLIAGASQTSGSAGPFGTSTNAIILGDATSISSNLSPSLLTGGAFTVARAITVGSSNTATTGVYTIGGSTATSSTFSGIETLNQSLTVTQVSSGTLNLTGNITSGSSGTQTLTFNNAGTVAQSTGVISDGTGTIAVTKLGAGTTTLSGANTYTGITTINTGVLNTGSLAAVNTTSGIGKGSVGGSAADLVFGGGTLQYNTAAAATTNRLFTIGNTTGLTATLDSSAASSANTMSFTGTGALGLGGSGARTLTLTGTNTGNNTLASIIGNGAGGTTSVTKSAAGTWVLSGANTYSGGTAVNVGTLALGNNTAAGSGTITLAGGTLTNSVNSLATANAINVTSASTLSIGNGLNWDMSSNITGSGNISYSPAGNAATLTLTGDNSGYTGTFTQTNVANNALNFNSASSGSAGAAWSLNNNTTIRTRFANFSGTINFGSLAGSAVGIINNTAGTVTVSEGALNTDTTFSGTFVTGTGVIALTKVGTGKLTLTGTNTYTGITSINAGKLVVGVGGAGSITSNVSVASAAILGGSGTITGNVTLAAESGSGLKDGGTLAPGNSPGTLTVTGTTTFNTGSIFSWDIDSSLGQADTDAGTGFDSVKTASLSGPDASVFNVVLASGDTFATPFWDSAHNWTNILSTDGTTANALNIASIFSSFSGTGVASDGTVSGQGLFTFTGGGSTLTWSAVPEPTSALAGLLIGAGLLRRRRKN